MRIALILSGGVGARTGQDVPKQYLTVYDTPIIVYTMLNIQESGMFDELYVVCADGWADFVYSYAKQYNVHIFKGTIPSGETRFETMSNGIKFLKNNSKSDDDVISIFDGNRPTIPHQIICNAVSKLEKSSCVVVLAPCYDSMYYADNMKGIATQYADRSILYMGQGPEVTHLKDAYDIICNGNESLNGYPMAAAMLQMQRKVVFVEGSSKSMKITTADDFAILKSLLRDQRLNSIK